MRARACLVSVVLVLLLAGCGGGSYKTAPVSGRVTLGGKPLANAVVTFVPVDGAAGGEPLPSSVGITDGDGRYSLVLDRASKAAGAVLGKHKVIILLGAPGGSNDTQPTFHKQLPERYNRRTQLTSEVPDAGTESADFALTVP